MSPRAAARAWADKTVQQAISGLFGVVEAERAHRRANPCRQALFHRRMAATLTGAFWRARRRYHRWQAQRWGAKCWAATAADDLDLCAIAERCGIPQPTE